MKYPVPDNDTERVASLQKLDILDTPAEERFDRLTRLASQFYNAPVSMLTFVDKERQWFKSARGHLIDETPRVESFCQHTIMKEGPLVVQDAKSDPRYFDLPAVFDLGIRFYAGVPIRSLDQQIVGTLCVLDFESRETKETDLRALVDLAHCAQTELRVLSFMESERKLLSEMGELKRLASIDKVARCWTESFGLEILNRMIAEGGCDARQGLGVLLVSLEKVSQVNETYGREAGDFYLREAANRIRMALTQNACLSRSSLASFMVLLPNLPAEKFDSVCRAILQQIAGSSFQFGNLSLSMDACGGYAVFSGGAQLSSTLVNRAAQALKRSKEKGSGTVSHRI
jgi:diguanylate cyclase (GGDEF)-like protein